MNNEKIKDRITAETANAYEMKMICDLNAIAEQKRKNKKKCSNPIYSLVTFSLMAEKCSWVKCIETAYAAAATTKTSGEN